MHFPEKKKRCLSYSMVVFLYRSNSCFLGEEYNEAAIDCVLCLLFLIGILEATWILQEPK